MVVSSTQHLLGKGAYGYTCNQITNFKHRFGLYHSAQSRFSGTTLHKHSLISFAFLPKTETHMLHEKLLHQLFKKW